MGKVIIGKFGKFVGHYQRLSGRIHAPRFDAATAEKGMYVVLAAGSILPLVFPGSQAALVCAGCLLVVANGLMVYSIVAD